MSTEAAYDFYKDKRGRAYEGDVRDAPPPPPRAYEGDVRGAPPPPPRAYEGDGDEATAPAPPLQPPRDGDGDGEGRAPLPPVGAVGGWRRAPRGAMDWNAEFQRLLALPESEEKFRRLFHLAHDFVYAAVAYAQIIISELGVPDEDKTIKPIRAGGVAGGVKFHCSNILFKKLVDTELSSGSWMYGGSARDDAKAAKSGSHELKGIMSWYYADTPGLHFPLMAVIDFKGFRMLAISVLPIDTTTIVYNPPSSPSPPYGSCDGAKTVHRDNEEVASKVESAAAVLNLRPHVAGTCDESLQVLAAPGDLECHVGRDGLVYMLDFARTMPPEDPARSGDPRAMFFNLLRPELVRRNPVPLCSDAYTNWQALDPRRDAYNADIVRATQELITGVIPRFCEWLDGLENASAGEEAVQSYLSSRARFAEQFARIHGYAVGPGGAQEQQAAAAAPPRIEGADIEALIQEMHRVGINIRYMGLVRDRVTSQRIKDSLLLEMTSRVVKNTFRERFRERMQELKTLSEEPFKETAIGILAQLVGAGKSQCYWREISDRVSKHYPSAGSYAGLEESVDPLALVTRVQEITGVRLSPAAMRALAHDADTFEFVDSDVEAIVPRVRHMNIIDFSEAMALCLTAERKTGGERMRLMSLCERKFEAPDPSALHPLRLSAISSAPDNYLALMNLGKVLMMRAETAAGVKGLQLLKSAIANLDKALLVRPGCVQATELLCLAKTEFACREHDDLTAKALFQSAASLIDAVALSTQTSMAFVERLRAVYRRQQLPSRTVVLGFVALHRAVLARLATFGADAAEHRVALLFATADLCLFALGRPGGGASAGCIMDTAAALVREALALSSGSVAAVAQMAGSLCRVGGDADVSSRRSALVAACRLFDLVVELCPGVPAAQFLLSKANALLDLDALDQSDGAHIAQAAAVLSLLYESDPAAVRGVLSVARGSAQLERSLRLAAQSERLRAAVEEDLAALSSVELAECPCVVDSCLAVLARSARPTSLCLEYCVQITDDGLNALLANMVGLRELSLRGCTQLQLQEVSFPAGLVSLNVANTACTSRTLELVGEACGAALAALYVANCPRVDDEALEIVAHRLPGLRLLNVKNSVKASSASLCKAVTFCEALEKLNLKGCSKVDDAVLLAVSHLQYLGHLNIDSCNRITCKGIEYLVNGGSCSSLSTLNVRSCRSLDDASLERIATSFPNLQELNIGRIPRITADGVSAALRALPRLRLVNLDQISCFSPTASLDLSMLRSVTSINLTKCGDVTDDVLERLLAGCSGGVRALNVSVCPVELAQVPSLAAHAATLAELDLSSTRVCDRTLSTALARMPALQGLALENCYRVSYAVPAVAEGSPGIARLNLINCRHLTNTMAALVCERLRGLSSLLLDGCTLLTGPFFMQCDPSASSPLSGLTALRHLSVRGTCIDGPAVSSIAHRCRLLRYINLADCNHLDRKATEDLHRSCLLLWKMNLSLHNKGMIKELKQKGFAEDLKVVPEEDKKWLKKRSDADEQGAAEELPAREPVVYQPFEAKVPYSVLLTRPPECDPAFLEKYLTQEEFAELFPADFYDMPVWRQVKLKQERKLF
eukprot:m51a1_g8680 hypothetical protein (1589) ;mRNA; f:172987-179501